MLEESQSRTRASLLRRAAVGDELAWLKLDRLYRPLLVDWARQARASELDADEAASEVLVTLVRFLSRFSYDPNRSFRAYLRTMLKNELKRLGGKKLATQDESQLRDLVCQAESQQSLIELLISEEEQLKIPTVLLAARQRVKKESTWRSWEMTELHGKSARDVATELGIPVANVYVNRQRVLEMISRVGRELADSQEVDS